MMLTQHLSCFEKLRADNVKQDFGAWYWLIDGEKSIIKTIMPKKIKEKQYGKEENYYWQEAIKSSS